MKPTRIVCKCDKGSFKYLDYISPKASWGILVQRKDLPCLIKSYIGLSSFSKFVQNMLK